MGSAELIIVVLVVVLVFGASWLPKTARNLGRAKVEIDKTQKQLTDAKQQVVEATGLDKAEQVVRKANKALNQTPQGLIKGAAAGALSPKPASDVGATSAQPEDAPEDNVPEAGADADSAPEDSADADSVPEDSADADSVPEDSADAENAETVNVDWSDG